MQYRELLTKVQKLGFDEVGRFKTEGLEVASIANPSVPIVIPFAFPNRQVILENGDESEIEDEVVDALLRWIAYQSKRRH
jgi:hypothetical protein